MSDHSNSSAQRIFRIVPESTQLDPDLSNASTNKTSSRAKPQKKKKKKNFLLNWKRWVIGVPLSLFLPFILLVRLSSLFYSKYQLNAWVAVLTGSLIALGLFTGILYFVARRLGMKPGHRTAKTLTIVFASYTLYLLVFVSASNVKAPEISATYTALHPVIRLALSSFMLLDRDVVVTDSQRHVVDYQRMGLKTPNSSLHYTQQNGFVHAVDLRTNGRSSIRNLLTAAYFRAMGFSTLRHAGTADHLHVSLRIPES